MLGSSPSMAEGGGALAVLWRGRAPMAGTPL